MFTEYGHIKQYRQSPFTLECEVFQQVYPALSVRSHLRTKKHQKNAIEFTKQIMLKQSADQSIYQSNFKVVCCNSDRISVIARCCPSGATRVTIYSTGDTTGQYRGTPLFPVLYYRGRIQEPFSNISS